MLLTRFPTAKWSSRELFSWDAEVIRAGTTRQEHHIVLFCERERYEIDWGLGGLHQATRKLLKPGNVLQEGLERLVHTAANLNT